MLMTLSSAAWGSGSSATPNPVSVSDPSRGYPLTTVIWPSRQIPTCWEMDSAAFNHYAPQRELVRQAVASTWEASSKVRFVGWQQCNGVPNQGVSIGVQDVGPYAWGLGHEVQNQYQGVMLNFEYANWSRECRTKRDYCIRVIAVHEFGHVLGFAHEQNRPDTPDAACAAREQGTNGNVLVGAWDLASVMNYCNPRYSGDGQLSPTDIAMVQAYYGRPGEPEPQPEINIRADLIPSIYLLTN